MQSKSYLSYCIIVTLLMYKVEQPWPSLALSHSWTVYRNLEVIDSDPSGHVDCWGR